MSHPECLLAQHSAASHGAFSHETALSTGLTRRQIEYHLESGKWVQIHVGVYRASTTPETPDLLEMAAVLAAGKYGCLSHRSAAYRLGLRRARPKEINVFSAHWQKRIPSGVLVHRCRAPQKLDVVVVDGLPCTSVARTVLDVAHIHPRELPSTADLAVRDGKATREELCLFARRSRGHHGQKRLRRRLEMQPLNLEEHDSDGETAFEALASVHWPHQWVHHQRVATRERSFEIDFAFPAVRLAVEIDGRHHLLQEQAEFDAHRDALLTEAGWETLRVTRLLVLTEPARVVALVDAALHARKRYVGVLNHAERG